MKIVCPQCAFERTIPEDRLPASAVIATCPHCQHRFRVVRPAQAPQSAPVEDDRSARHAEGPAAARQDHADPQRHDQGPIPQDTPDLSRSEDEDDPLPPGAVIPGSARHEAPRTASHAAPHSQEHGNKDAGSPSPDASPAATQAKKDEQKQKRGLGWGSVSAPDTPDMPAEEEIEYRRAAAAAYEKQAEKQDGKQDDAFALSNPWEHPEKDGYAASFYQTCVRVMFTAPRFFSGLNPDTPQRTALIFFLLVCAIQLLIDRFWGGVLASIFPPESLNDPQLKTLLAMLNPQENILLALLKNSALKVLEIFVASALFFLAFRLLAPDRANYQLIFQVIAYSTAPALLCVVPVAGPVAGFIWSLACCLVGCRYAMRLNWPQTVMGIVPVYCLSIIVVLQIVTMLHQFKLG